MLEYTEIWCHNSAFVQQPAYQSVQDAMQGNSSAVISPNLSWPVLSHLRNDKDPLNVTMTFYCRLLAACFPICSVQLWDLRFHCKCATRNVKGAEGCGAFSNHFLFPYWTGLMHLQCYLHHGTHADSYTKPIWDLPVGIFPSHSWLT